MTTETTWRLVRHDAPLDGALNMAIDQAILEAVSAGEVPPTLRFYGWQPPCLSLGYMQPIDDVDEARLAAQGWGLVRRITGGRAILHTDELTYSVTVRDQHPVVEGDIVASYRRLSGALLDGLHRLGAQADADRRAERHPDAKGPVCFEVPSHYEITFEGKKLVGSAQVRKLGVVLQHGSLPLMGDITRICDALTFSSDERRERVRARVRTRAATLAEVLGQVVTWDQAVAAMQAGFEHTFDLVFESTDLTPAEQARAEELRAAQYATREWHARFRSKKAHSG